MKLSSLTYWKNNPRKISEENLSKLKKSIERDPDFLAKRPILVNHTQEEDPKTKEIKDVYTVYWGNQRLKALLDLWYEEIDDSRVSIDEDLSNEVMERRSFVDNTEFGEYDTEILKDNFTLEELQDLELPYGEIPLYIYDEPEDEEEEEEEKPTKVKVIVYCDDLAEAEMVKQDIEWLWHKAVVKW